MCDGNRYLSRLLFENRNICRDYSLRLHRSSSHTADDEWARSECDSKVDAEVLDTHMPVARLLSVRHFDAAR